ncbi:MAG: tRNA threonylcarbamoyladenosine biosynthesis protein TsaB [Pseudonocardiales bacterium]|nr:tRNA threonylcarbamoyladenosine biosynthesis protein TsaB [Pseudonocardiales bacterium]
MLALVIDTSSAAVTAGVVRFPDASSPEVLAERVTLDARAHGELLAPSIKAALAEAGVTLAQLSAVIAGVGPGPFTGLRVGLVTAAAIADVGRIPAYGVCSLDAIAAEVGIGGSLLAAEPPARGSVLVAGDARRKEVYWAHYLDGARQAGPSVEKPAAVAELAGEFVPAVTAMAGAGARLYADQLGYALLDEDFPTVRGLAAVAAQRVLGRAPGEPLTPLYLRRPDAVAAASHKRVTP